MTRPCVCQPTDSIPEHGEVRRMRWCPRCGQLYPLSGGPWCTECQRHNSVDVRLVLADVTARRTSLAAKGHRRYGLATSDAATVRNARLCTAQWAAEHSLSIRGAHRAELDMITPEEGDVR